MKVTNVNNNLDVFWFDPHPLLMITESVGFEFQVVNSDTGHLIQIKDFHCFLSTLVNGLEYILKEQSVTVRVIECDATRWCLLLFSE